MRRLLQRNVALVVVAMAACVPSTDAGRIPAGAAGARVVPADAARGIPFTTTDGWTVTLDRIAVIATVSTFLSGEVSGADYLVWDGTREASHYTPAIPVGPLAIEVAPEGGYIGPSNAEGSIDDQLPGLISASGLAPEVQALLSSAPDNVHATLAGAVSYQGVFPPVDSGPAVVFAAHATKAGRTVRIALSLASAYAGVTTVGVAPDVERIDVVANDVRFALFELHPERIFATTADEASTMFEPFAAADADGDGTVTAAELLAVPLPFAADAGGTAIEDRAGMDASTEDDAGADGTGADIVLAPACSAASVDAYACVTLLDRIADNAQHVIVPVTPSH